MGRSLFNEQVYITNMRHKEALEQDFGESENGRTERI